MTTASVAFAAALLAGYLTTPAIAQKPFFQGALYLQPGSNNQKCLQTSPSNGARVVLGDCNGSADQQWTFNGGAVTAYNGQYCLDVTDGNNVNGVKLQVWQCYQGSANQQFYWTRDNQWAISSGDSFERFSIKILHSALLGLTMAGVSILLTAKWAMETKSSCGTAPVLIQTNGGTRDICSMLFPTKVKSDRLALTTVKGAANHPTAKP